MVLSYHKEDKNSTVLHQKVLKKIFFIILSSKVHKLPQKTMIKLVALHNFCLFIALKMFHMKLSIKLLCFTWNIIFVKFFLAHLIQRQCFIWNIAFKRYFFDLIDILHVFFAFLNLFAYHRCLRPYFRSTKSAFYTARI